MNFEEPASCTRIRAEAAEFVEEHVTNAVREHEYYSGDGVALDIHRAMGAKGWVVPRWPRHEGGADLSATDAEVLLLELATGGVPKIGFHTTAMPADVIRSRGTDEQRSRFLPGVAKGDTLICLGYTEPDSGSDVAAAKTRAVRRGDRWLISGQKVFTTYAHLAQYSFLLARTDPAAPKHRGLTMFLVPLDLAGVEIQPIRTLGGERTNTVYYDDVEVGDLHRIGEVDQGWSVLCTALQQEHSGGLQYESSLLHNAIQEWAATRRPDGRCPLDDERVRDTLAEIRIRNEVARLLGFRVTDRIDRGIPVDMTGPMAALYGSESYLANAQAAIDLLGPAGVLGRGEPGAVVDGLFEHLYRASIAATIYGGTSEVIRDQIAQRALGLPRLRT